MSQLQDLVPPLVLCKKIPAGEFEKSCLYWDRMGVFAFAVFPRECGDCPSFGVSPSNENIYPAPTLQEILLEIEKASGWCPTAYRLNGYWTVDCQDDKDDIMNDVMEQTDPDNPATAALKLWLKLKGIKYE